MKTTDVVKTVRVGRHLIREGKVMFEDATKIMCNTEWIVIGGKKIKNETVKLMAVEKGQDEGTQFWKG
jgi:hypothetical protein